MVSTKLIAGRVEQIRTLKYIRILVTKPSNRLEIATWMVRSHAKHEGYLKHLKNLVSW